VAKKKQIKIGVKKGGGPPPGYEWNVWILDAAFEDAMDFLSPLQYEHMAELVRDLATHSDPTQSDALSLDKIETFHELRDWGGVLCGLNVRLFYGVDKKSRGIVVLGIIAKKNNGATLVPDRVLMRNRWRKYKRGEYGALPI
jgi:hypothetical protein